MGICLVKYLPERFGELFQLRYGERQCATAVTKMKLRHRPAEDLEEITAVDHNLIPVFTKCFCVTESTENEQESDC